MSKNTDSIDWHDKYKYVRKEYHKLVDEHNALVDEHNALTDDARALVSFIEAFTKGLQVYVLGGIIIGEDTLSHINPPHGVVDEGRIFCSDMHNEVVDFLTELQQNKHPREVYQNWLNKCNQVYDDFMKEE